MRLDYPIKRAAAVALASTMLWSPAARADEPTAADAPDQTAPLERVVVTAQKRSQQLFDVPMSITVIPGSQIERRGAQTIEDLQYSVPGLSITQFAPGQQRVQLRGISAPSGLPTVGVYLDELPLNTEVTQTGIDVRLLDMARIEVLRGPQGTLYGQGAMGGTIRYITRDPDLSAFDYRLAAQGSSVDDGGVDWKAEGVLNIPLAEDRFGVRIAGAYQAFGGWIDNTRLGLENTNEGESSLIRGKALFHATDHLDISLLFAHQRLDLNDLNLADADGRIATAVTEPTKSQADLADLIVTYDLGAATLLSSTGWIDRSDVTRTDLSATFIPFLEAPPPFGFGFPPGVLQSVAAVSSTDNRIFTQEVRLGSNGEGSFTWTIGAMWRDSEAINHLVQAIDPDIVPLTLLGVSGTLPSNSRSWAVFGEGAYDLLPDLEATFGLRYFEDERTQDTTSTFFGIASTDRNRDTFRALSPRFNLLWRASEDIHLYANAAKGFRSGGFNLVSSGLGVVTVQPTYDPETLWSYEVGGNFRSSDSRWTAALAVYRNDWSDVQSLAFAPGSPVQFTANGGTLSGWGIDAQLAWRPTQALILEMTGGYNDTTYRSNTAEHFRGDPADYVPQYTASASAEYRFGWGENLPGFARVDYQITDGYQIFERNLQVAPALADTQEYLNLKIGLDRPDWELSVFANNILNEDGITYPAFGALHTPSRPEPRTMGLAIARNM